MFQCWASTITRYPKHVAKIPQVAHNNIKGFFKNLKSKEYKERGAFMNLAKVSANGQITVPLEIRRKLNIKEGDKIIFLEKPNGEIVLQNSSVFAIRQAQSKLSDIQLSEDEILQDIMGIRYSGEKQL
jgi:AbrB family looped-hinge helix DNA binding protein